MQWESLGFKYNPFNTDPIKQNTLSLYVGHEESVHSCKDLLSGRNVTLVVEGARGVGTTSFSNALRFNAQEKKYYLTPQNEIRVERGWTLETLLSVIIANVIREVELFHAETITQDHRFQNAKALSSRISEVYRSLGLDAFGFGFNYGKSAGGSSQPMIVSSAVLGHHLEDLTLLIQSIGYKHGILVQLNNLDIGAIHAEDHMQYLFNALRDYVQTDGVSWIFVGDLGLRRFIAQSVDRLDDIVSFEVRIEPLSEKEYRHLLQKRIVYYTDNPRAKLPVSEEVLLYLYQITKGRLRYTFGLLSRLVSGLHIGDLTDLITLNLAKPMVVKLAKERVSRHNLTPTEEEVLRWVVKLETASVGELAQTLKKSPQFISKILATLTAGRLITVKSHGRNRLCSPTLDAEIAYTE